MSEQDQEWEKLVQYVMEGLAEWTEFQKNLKVIKRRGTINLRELDKFIAESEAIQTKLRLARVALQIKLEEIAEQT